MTEKEKMIEGLPYFAADEQLNVERTAMKVKCFNYNAISPDKAEEKYAALKDMLGSVGKKVIVESPFYCDYGYNITIGDNCFFNHDTVMLDCGRIEIGSNVFVGPQCGFYTPIHPLDVESRNRWDETTKPVKICDNVWIAGGVIIMPGVTIGEGSVIGAGSVVTKDVPPNSLAYGNPCKVIRKLK